MIKGIGTDILKISRIEQIFLKNEKGFIQKILHKNEKEEYLNLKKEKEKIHYLAKHFCAKEAFLKALGTGMKKPYFLNQIEIQHNMNGKPFFVFHGEEKVFFKNAFLSISDEKEFVLSFVVLENENAG